MMCYEHWTHNRPAAHMQADYHSPSCMVHSETQEAPAGSEDVTEDLLNFSAFLEHHNLSQRKKEGSRKGACQN